MRTLRLLLGLLGLFLAVALVADQGVGTVLAATAALGWGILPIAVFEVVPLSLKAQGWRRLLPAPRALRARDLLLARWIRQSVSQLLPVAQIGGDLAGARVLYLRGLQGETAGAATVVDMTLAAGAQMVFTVLGVLMLVEHTGNTGMVISVLAATALLAGGIVAFALLQRRGVFGSAAAQLRRVAPDHSLSMERLDAAVRGTYERPGAVAADFSWQLLAQIVSTIEILLIAMMLSIPVTAADAFVLQSLARGIRAAAFMVPAGLGVQEGGILLLAGALALDPAGGLAIALVKRARELLIGLPALLLWQRMEHRGRTAQGTGA